MGGVEKTMKKLLILCFTIFFSILSALSCFNFAFEALDQIEEDKVAHPFFIELLYHVLFYLQKYSLN